MGALASTDGSGGSSLIQNKVGIAAPTLTPEELLHQQKVAFRKTSPQAKRYKLSLLRQFQLSSIDNFHQ